MSTIKERDVLLDIPNLNGPSGETLVAAALDGIAGVVNYDIQSMRREARITFDENQLDENQLMDALKKKTRYRTMSIKNVGMHYLADYLGNKCGDHQTQWRE